MGRPCQCFRVLFSTFPMEHCVPDSTISDLPLPRRQQRMQSLLIAGAFLADFVKTLEKRRDRAPKDEAILKRLRFAKEHFPDMEEILVISDVLDSYGFDSFAAASMPESPLNRRVDELESHLAQVEGEFARFLNRISTLLGAMHAGNSVRGSIWSLLNKLGEVRAAVHRKDRAWAHTATLELQVRLRHAQGAWHESVSSYEAAASLPSGTQLSTLLEVTIKHEIDLLLDHVERNDLHLAGGFVRRLANLLADAEGAWEALSKG